MAPWAAFSIDIGFPSTKWTETPFGMQKHSQNSCSLRSSIGFSELGVQNLHLSDHLSHLCQSRWLRQCPFSQAYWSNGSSKSCIAQCQKLESNYLALQPKGNALRCPTGCHARLRVCHVQGTQLRSLVPNPSRGFSRYDIPNNWRKGRQQIDLTKPQNTKMTKPNPNRG